MKRFTKEMFTLEGLITGFIIVIFLFVIVHIVVAAIDRSSHEQSVSIDVVDKYVEQSCTDGNCSSRYYLETDEETIEIKNKGLFRLIRTGRRHHVVIRGDNYPLIVEVFE